MYEYLNLNRRFGLSTKFDSLAEFEGLGKRLTWDKVLEGRLSLIKARANFGKSAELEACAKRLRSERKFAAFVAVRRLLGQVEFATALGPDDEQSYSSWRATAGAHLFLFVDSLDEAALGREEGLQLALRRVTRAVSWPNSNVTWVLSSRPATLTPEVLELLQAELRTTLYSGETNASDEVFDDEPEVFTERIQTEQPELGEAVVIGQETAVTSSAESTRHKVEQLRVYDLLPLDSSAARLYLSGRHNVADPTGMLAAARRFGLGGLAAGPGSLDVLVFADLVRSPPNNLTDAFERMVRGVHSQQRADRREREVGNPPPESLAAAVEKLSCASVVCQLPNIELSQDALGIREGVLSSRPIVGALLSQDSLNYLLGSRLFIDSGFHQVKVYPDELLPYLAAKRLAARVQSPEDATRLLANFTWSASTGECGVHRVYLPLAGWLSTLSAHCRHELLQVEPQAVAFFGDLRNPQIPLSEAAAALTGAIERLVNVGDVLGRRHYTLTVENFWQVGKPGIAETLRVLFERHADDWRARDTLLDIAAYVRLDLFREPVMRAHGWNYVSLLKNRDDLYYIVSLERDDDGKGIAQALLTAPDVAEQVVSSLLARLAWKWLDARAIAEVAARQFLRGRGAFHVDWALTREVADEAEPFDLYALTRSLLVRLARSLKSEKRCSGGKRLGHEFVELVMDMMALTIERPGTSALRLSRLCLVLHRLVRDFHHGGADKQKLRASLEKATDVRRLFLRALIGGTDRTTDAIWKSVFVYGTFVVWLDGDDAAIGEPGFSAMVAELKSRAAMPPPPEPLRRQRGPKLDKKSKSQLFAVSDGLRDASNENALAWVAGWLAQTIHNSRYGECDFSVFATQAGEDIAAAVRSGFSAIWHDRAPRWDEDQLNSTYQITIAGLQGLHLDLGDGSALPPLSDQEVAQAIRYAPFEINGYPKWFWPVVRARESVALNEFRTILARATLGAVSADKAEALIRHLDEAPAAIQSGLAGDAWAYVLSSVTAHEYATEVALTIATTRGSLVDQPIFEREAKNRIAAAFVKKLQELTEAPLAMTAEEAKARQKLEADVKESRRLRANATVWGTFWLWHFPDSFGRDWEAWRAIDRRASEDFMFELAASLGEDRKGRLRDAAAKGLDGLRTLKILYEWVISIVREPEDISHEDGRVYSMGARDHAQQLRDALLPAIASAKSQAAYDMLEALRATAVGPRAKYIRQLQFTLREDEAATLPLAQQSYDRFEHDFAPPVSGYVSFAQTVLGDLLAVKRDIEEGEFSLRRFFNTLNFARVKTASDGLALEEDFQALLGSQLNSASRGRYAVTLEPILPEMTRRDVLCQVGDMRATIELKMSIRWSLEDYLIALEEQLKSQYMQAINSKIGFFVIVLQEARRWDVPGGGAVDFSGLLETLATKARELQGRDPSLFLRVIGIDARPKEDFRAARAAKTATARGVPKYSDGSGNTWFGQGRRPKWVRDALAAGRTLDELLTGKQMSVGS